MCTYMAIQLSPLILYMDHLHGLCKDCVSRCSEIFTFSKNENECSRCNDQSPEIIFDDNGFITVLCTKCYLKQMSSPKKRQRSEYSFTSKQNNSIIIVPQPVNILYHSITKSDVLNKGFFASQGKMIKKIDKYFNRFQGRCEDAIKDLAKRSMVVMPAVSWDKVVMACNRTGSIMVVLVNQTYLLGFYHSEPIRIPDKTAVDDKESGFFMTAKAKLDLQFYRANQESVSYNTQAHLISIGKPSCLQVYFDGAKPKVRCELLNKIEQWPQLYIYKL